MYCPICNLELIKQKDYFYCPQKHGVLLNAKHLIDKQEAEVEDIHQRENTKTNISCPKCNNIMHKTNYNSTEIFIDSCLNCHSRWLDSGEFTKIKNYKPNLTAEQLLYLLEVDRMMDDEENQLENTIPGYASGITGGLGRGLSAGDTKRTLGWIGAGAVYGTIRTLVKGNKYQKIVLFIALVLFFTFLYFLWSFFKSNY